MSIDARIVKQLESIGLTVDPYKRGPAGRDSFTIALNGSLVKMWQGLGDVTVKTNRRKRQALVNVIERPRLVKTRSIIHVYKHYTEGSVTPKAPKTLQDAINLVVDRNGSTNIKDRANITVPRSTMKVVGFTAKTSDIGPLVLSFDLELRTRTTKTSFLVGYDESGSQRPFICMLRSFVDSIEEAYQDLLPVGVQLKPGYKRQGEWFLNPASQKLQGELCSKIHKGQKNHPLDNIPGQRWRGPSNHRGFYVRYKGKGYVMGRVYDTRKRHADVVLTSWHEVIRNNEVVAVSQTCD